MQNILKQLKQLKNNIERKQILEQKLNRDYKKEKSAIQWYYHVKRARVEYTVLKGNEVKAFLIYNTLVLIIIAITFFMFFNGQITSLLLAFVMATVMNIAYILTYKTYKVEEWYIVGAFYYGILFSLFAAILLAYGSIVYIDGGSEILLSGLGFFLVSIFISYLIGGIFPVTNEFLENYGLKKSHIVEAIKQLDMDEQEALNALQKTYEKYRIEMDELTGLIEKETVVPEAYKSNKAIRAIIEYFSNQPVTSIAEALERFDEENRDSIRQIEENNA